MNIAIDISPLKRDHYLQHRVRGTRFYIENLKESLLRQFPSNSYNFFTRGEKLPRNIDVVHYPYFEPFFLTLPFYSSLPKIVTIHDLIPLVFPREFPSGLIGKLKWRLQQIAMKGINAIITDSYASKEDIKRIMQIPDEKIHVVYLAASNEFRPIVNKTPLKKTKEKYKLPEKFVLYVGDATWNKNLVRLIQAVRKTKIPLVMVGAALKNKLTQIEKSNPWNKDLIKVQKLAKEDKTILTGFVETENLVNLYNLATVFVMPSIYEGFGLPVLEAMACGLPVITSKAGSLEEVAGDGAYFVDPDSVDDIAKGVQDVYVNIDLQRSLSEKGIVRAKNFSWEKTANQTMDVFKKVAIKS